MRSLSYLVCIGLIGCGGSSAPNPQVTGPAPKPVVPTADEESAKLQGTWRVIAITAGGNKVAEDKVKNLNLTYVFDGNKITVKRPDRPDNPGTFTLDPKKTPLRIDLFIQGQGREKGIYEISGTTLKLC